MNNIVESRRTIYTTSEFAKESLIYLQEIGQTKALKKHTSSRSKLDSFLFFIVLEGTGFLTYNSNTYRLEKGSCVFIDCNSKYSHTSDNWTIKWIHFNGKNIPNIYKEYKKRNGQNIFFSNSFTKYEKLFNEMDDFSKINNYIKSICINEKISSLLTLIMLETVNVCKKQKKHNIDTIKNYIDKNFIKNITLDHLANIFYINKFYLTRIFKFTYGITINNYINNLRITKAKELIRFSDLDFENIAISCGINDNNYFSRIFKKTEGISPKEYRRLWKN